LDPSLKQKPAKVKAELSRRPPGAEFRRRGACPARESGIDTAGVKGKFPGLRLSVSSPFRE